MAGDDCGEVKELIGSISCASHIHGEMTATGKDADFRLMKVVEYGHVRHHIGVARDIDCAPFGLNHKAAFATHSAQSIFRPCGRGMNGIHHCYRNIAQADSSPFIKAND